MQTAAIPYRVADFLKQHPPFQFMDESELVSLAARGRVKFHDSGEYICWQSSPHTPYVFVIQQGSVSLWDESAQPATLRDIRGPGDIIGTERFNGAPVSLYSAKASSEVVVYALQAADLEPLLARHPQAALYVGAYSAVTAGYAAPGKRPLPHKATLADLPLDRLPLMGPDTMSVREAAGTLREAGALNLVLVDARKDVTGLLTTKDLLDWIAAGALQPDQPASKIARSTALTIAPRTLVSECTLAMGAARSSTAVVTTDGTASSPIQRIITKSSLALVFGDHPIAIMEEIGTAPNFEALRALNTRARTWILDHLSSPATVDWLCCWSDLVNQRILERLIQLTGYNPDTLYCFYGAAGRCERLTSVAPRIAVIGMPTESLEFELAECGYLAPEPISFASINEWKRRFSSWIHDPIRTQVYNKRPFFDLRPVMGPGELFSELEAHVRTELANEPAFLRILANDCFSALPPLTFFRDLVVEGSGEHTDKFRIEKSALEPLADVARVLSLAAGVPLGASTHERFQQAARLLPEKEVIFRDAAETMRLILMHQASAGLRMGTSGTELPLSILSRQDRQMLKSGFHAIHDLLEFTATGDWLEAI